MKMQLSSALLCAALLTVASPSTAQSYQVTAVASGGTITGTVKWTGAVPKPLTMPISKDPSICDPEGKGRAELDRLIIGPDGGVENTVVYLKGMTSGKAFDFPAARQTLDQRHCRYEPHVLLVPQQGSLAMKSSDATLHTIHMDGAASYNLPFPFQNQTVSRIMNTAGIVNLKCNGGHVWMNAEVVVAPHPYYAVTDVNGHFEIKDVPPGRYEIVAWHEGWIVRHNEGAYDVLTEKKVERPVFSDPRTWDKQVDVSANGSAVVNFSLSDN